MAATFECILVAMHPVISHAETGPARKSVKTCNTELTERAAEIEKAGESPAMFFHACWTHATPGQPTPIETRNTAEKHIDVAPRPHAPASHGTRDAMARRSGRGVLARHLNASSDEAPRRRVPRLVERREPFAPNPPSQVPPVIADPDTLLSRVLGATGLPAIQVPILVPGTLEIAPLTIAPR